MAHRSGARRLCKRVGADRISRCPELLSSLRRPFIDCPVSALRRRTIDVPSAFFGGKSDWAVYMTPGAVDVMRSRACTRMQEYALLDGAGHWLQQEQPDPVCSALVSFLRNNTERSQRP